MLFLTRVCAALIVVPVIVLLRLADGLMADAGLYVAPASLATHLQSFNKAVIISASWIFAYFAMKHLPISIVSPVGATGPVWTLAGALILFHENVTAVQYFGIGVMVLSYWWLSSVGGKEGIKFSGNRWILFTIFAAIFGAVSALYDKYLIRNLGYPPLVVQAWFLIYLVPVLGLALVLFRLVGRPNNSRFVWRWSVPVIAIMLILADVLYFRAISYTGSLISVLSAIRASCVLVSFLVGGILFCELRLKSKAVAVAGIVAGTCLLFVPV